MLILCSDLQVALSQDDLKMLLRILMENLGEAGGPQPGASRQEAAVQLQAGREALSGRTPKDSSGETSGNSSVEPPGAPEAFHVQSFQFLNLLLHFRQWHHVSRRQ